jgi:hypothetical protein
MNEYAVDDQGAGLDDGGDAYTGTEGDYGGFEDFGQGAGAEQGFDVSPADGGFADVEQAITDALEMGVLTPQQVGEFMRAQVAAEIAPVAEAANQVQTEWAIQDQTAKILDWQARQFEAANVPDDRWDEGHEATHEKAVELYPQEVERVADELWQTLRDGGVTEEDIMAIPEPQAQELLSKIYAQAATDATIKATSWWIRSLDPAAGVPKNYSVADRISREGPLPSTRQAFLEAGWAPEDIQPRSVGEALTQHDYRRGGKAFEVAAAQSRGAA